VGESVIEESVKLSKKERERNVMRRIIISHHQFYDDVHDQLNIALGDDKQASSEGGNAPKW
jgi:hypothetical protein